MRIDWKNIGVPLILAAITFADTLTATMLSVIIWPDIRVKLVPKLDNKYQGITTPSERRMGSGSKPKTHSPHNIPSLNIFCTENHDLTNIPATH